MSSIKVRSALFYFFMLEVLMGQEMSCPAEIELRLRAELPVAWLQESPVTRLRFVRGELFNRVQDRLFVLAPDQESTAQARMVQSWKLGQYRDLPLFLRCFYRGSSYTLSRKLDEHLQECHWEAPRQRGSRLALEGGRFYCR